MRNDYPHDENARWLWIKPLAAFQQTGDSEESRGMLAAALGKSNGVAPYLLGDKAVDWKRGREMTSEELAAIRCADFYREVWPAVPGALDWLRANHQPGGDASPERQEN